MPTPEEIVALATRAFTREELRGMSNQRRRTFLRMCEERLEKNTPVTDAEVEGLKEILDHVWPEIVETIALMQAQNRNRGTG